MVFTFILKANAQQATPAGNSVGQSQGTQLRQEIESLRQQAEQIRPQLQQLEVQAKPLREQLRSIRNKIKIDKEKLQNLREERRVDHEQRWKQYKAQQQPAPTGSQQK